MEPIKILAAAALDHVNHEITQAVSDEHWCCECGVSLPLTADDPRRQENTGNLKCGPCAAAHAAVAASVRAAEAAQRQAAYLAAVPKMFQRTRRELLPKPDKLDQAMRWNFGAKGLLLYGPSGEGKSRVLWEVAKREIFAGRQFRAVDAFELVKYPSLIMTGAAAAAKFADELADAELLLLDDIFKAKPTERVEELMFSVIDRRGANELPILMTSNDTGESLAGRLSEDRGGALVRRLRNYCHGIQF